MVKNVVEIKNASGLHARPAYRLVETAQGFQSDISFAHENVVHNAKSIIDVLSGCVCAGDQIELIVSGADEEEAMQTLLKEIADGLGEG